jgi:hypothetical protein
VTPVYGHYTVEGTLRVLLLHSRFLQVHAAVAGAWIPAEKSVTPEIDRSAAAERGERIYVRQQETWHGVPSPC